MVRQVRDRPPGPPHRCDEVAGLPGRRGQPTGSHDAHDRRMGLADRSSGTAGGGSAGLVDHAHEECEPCTAQRVDSGGETDVGVARLESCHHRSMEASEAGVGPLGHPKPSAVVAQGHAQLGEHVEVLGGALHGAALVRW